MDRDDAIAAFAQHVVTTAYDDLAQAAVDAAKTFILDTVGVGIVGSCGAMAQELAAAQILCGRGDDARVWSLGLRLPAPAAALCNAYQAHNSEFDCVHEEAVAHVMSAVLAAAMAVAEREGGVSGRRLIEAVVLGVDVGAGVGVAATSRLRFFRPANAGAFGAAAAVGKLMGFDRDRLINAFSITYAQLSGTMQAHTEGSMLLPMQMGFNARNAVVAADLAAAGVDGPKNILEGPYGYYALFEEGGDLARVVAELGQTWRITEVAHKPFPSGRATHGIVDGCLTLQRRHGFSGDDVARVVATVPPLVHQLVGRPAVADMDTNYARLCAPYVAACALLGGDVRLDDFSTEAYRDPVRLALAQRIEVVIDPAVAANTMTPVDVTVALQDDRRFEVHLDTVYGNPARAMTREAQLAKFRANCALAKRPLDAGQVVQLIAAIDDLDDVTDVRAVVDLMVAPEPA